MEPDSTSSSLDLWMRTIARNVLELRVDTVPIIRVERCPYSYHEQRCPDYHRLRDCVCSPLEKLSHVILRYIASLQLNRVAVT
jgi:hypothetical protein